MLLELAQHARTHVYIGITLPLPVRSSAKQGSSISSGSAQSAIATATLAALLHCPLCERAMARSRMFLFQTIRSRPFVLAETLHQTRGLLEKTATMHFRRLFALMWCCLLECMLNVYLDDIFCWRVTLPCIIDVQRCALVHWCTRRIEQTGRQPLLLFSLRMLCVGHSSYYPLAACLRRFLWAGLALLALPPPLFFHLFSVWPISLMDHVYGHL